MMERSLVCLGIYFDMLSASDITLKGRSEEAIPERKLIGTIAPRTWAAAQADEVPPKSLQSPQRIRPDS